ncbi:MAG: hypothetical protein PHR35_22650, partial [Kiritimatiellae bacterium]|nr:hypothetical protein [Kiritimatiellia bacterium]
CALQALKQQYRRRAEATPDDHVVLWFDACLFDQAMLAHILSCLHHLAAKHVELLCVDAFPGIMPFHGLGQLRPVQLASLYATRRPLSDAHLRFAVLADSAFATQDASILSALAHSTDAPLPWLTRAAARWLQEQAAPDTGMGRLECLAMDAVRAGCDTPQAIFAAVDAADEPPHFWGDTTLWAKINALADRKPPLLMIEGPTDRLPQWESTIPLNDFRITRAPNA